TNCLTSTWMKSIGLVWFNRCSICYCNLRQYLKEELFDKIGIDHKHIKWIRTPDGYEVAGGGMLATTEDNLRLMDLYRKDGIWEGERILSHDFVELATTKRIETRGFSPNCDEAVDHLLGYGFQIWMCQPEGSYRADGAFGQYSIVFPKQDLIISLTETTRKEDDGAQYPLDAIYPILDEIRDEALELNEEDWGKLKNKMRSLALPNPPFRPYSPVMEKIQDSRWVTKNGEFFYTPYHRDLLAGKEIPCSILELQLKFVDGGLNLSLQTECGEEFISVPMDGSRGYFVAPYREIPFRKVYSHGYWESEDILCLNFRWIESAYEKTIRMQFDDPFMNIFSEDLISFINLPCEDAVAVRE
ncbi:MAG: serine hydrolase, partial [Lachnospiraceae bacterium]|nr:serine hydrolase [Lachnospiraceae bacterium]